MRGWVFALAVVTAVAPGGAAGASVLCRQRSGALVIRDAACRKRERPVDLAPFVPAAPGRPALGWAHVLVSGGVPTLDPSRSRDVAQANLSHPVTGVVCFSGLGFSPQVALPVVDAANPGKASFSTAGVAPDAPVLGTCGAAAQAVVTTQDGVQNQDGGFYVVFY
ncbi:MAG TPA: hypothetical protein VFD84_07065 [Candidatus Binatia bacterium]|jgi:hypothetical protein|nr:hypothetical protein [Candidatus Binatia bacterium]